nr:MAG TPA: hypothetical protein [Herelleviridae sp.]
MLRAVSSNNWRETFFPLFSIRLVKLKILCEQSYS